MPQSTVRCLRALSVAVVALAFAAGCAPNRLLHQQANPEYVGKPFKRVLVVAVTKENVLGRVYEDRMVALLGERGIKGVPAYASLGSAGAVDEATLRGAIAKTGADGVLITRTTSVDESTVTTPGYTVSVGYGWGGFYGYYSGAWQTSYVPPQTTVVGPTRTVSETRLFDAKSGTLAWSCMIGTTDRDGESDSAASVQQYAGIVFDAMARDGII